MRDAKKLPDTALVKRVAIFGYASSGPEEEIYNDVYVTAAHLAEHGYTIVNGGGPGLMDAATKGAESANGDTVTVTFDPKYAPGFEGKYFENKPDREITTTNYIDRMFTLMKESDYFVIFNGGTGTLSEFATVWLLAKLYTGRHKGIALYGNQWRPVVSAIVNHMFIQPEAEELLDIVTSPVGVIRAIKSYEAQMKNMDLVACELAGDEAPFMVCKPDGVQPRDLRVRIEKKN